MNTTRESLVRVQEIRDHFLNPARERFDQSVNDLLLRFATWGAGEIDAYTKARHDYGVELQKNRAVPAFDSGGEVNRWSALIPDSEYVVRGVQMGGVDRLTLLIVGAHGLRYRLGL
jgi:hypothetical protein